MEEAEEEDTTCPACGEEMEFILISSATYVMFNDDDGQEQLRAEDTEPKDAFPIWRCACGHREDAVYGED